ncbi:hypothetical protein AVEN_238864-1 [Araneus ventricosus]|uniref:Uncharacterized protein n=1 Tax=Araneus ventricosus TaxID=182803 RepID=A0A4Y2EP70_ARAVE|nr:hypothetical protein AVEN_238864-1 [Araneus ventricosus]
MSSITEHPPISPAITTRQYRCLTEHDLRNAPAVNRFVKKRELISIVVVCRHPRADRPPAQLPAWPAEPQSDDSAVFHVCLHTRPILFQFGLPPDDVHKRRR